jgi:hypothetical protein
MIWSPLPADFFVVAEPGVELGELNLNYQRVLLAIVLQIKRHSISATADYIFDFSYSTVLYSLQRDRDMRLEHPEDYIYESLWFGH